MKILGIESADKIASVAIIEDEKLIGEAKSSGVTTHSVTLMPMLDKLVKEKHFDLKSIDAIAVSKGPGSYTGLRIGASTAKGLALVIKKPVIPVSTLAGMACSFWGSEYVVVPMLDARRGNVFAAGYTFEKNGDDVSIKEVLSEDLYEAKNLLEKIASISAAQGKEAVFLGSGSKLHAEAIADRLGDTSYIAPEEMDSPSAAFVALYGLKLYKDGKYVSGTDFAPNYLRPSQAERKKNEK